MWPEWICATRVIKSEGLCGGGDVDECMGACDDWARQVHAENVASSSTDELARWRMRSLERVVKRWADMSKACTRVKEVCDDDPNIRPVHQ